MQLFATRKKIPLLDLDREKERKDQDMGWSAENATNAYLQTLNTKSKVSSESNVAEFISAMAAGNGSKIMMDVCANATGPTTLALIAAAHQTDGRVVCIVPTVDDLRASEMALGEQTSYVELVVGDVVALLRNHVDVCGGGTSDFLLVDCENRGHGKVFAVAQAMMAGSGRGRVVVEYNAMGGRDRRRVWGPVKAELLPIGGGLRVSRVVPEATEEEKRVRRRSQWVVRVDECTGEEHVFRVAAPVHGTRRVQTGRP